MDPLVADYIENHIQDHLITMTMSIRMHSLILNRMASLSVCAVLQLLLSSVKFCEKLANQLNLLERDGEL